MARSVVADAGFILAVLDPRDRHHAWAAAVAQERQPPWLTNEAALSEALFIVGRRGLGLVAALIQRDALRIGYSLLEEPSRVLALMQKYADVPMSLADACLVRMSEILPDPVILTTDADFRLYRRHGREVVPCELPP